MEVDEAFMNSGYIGKGYGHILYRFAARRARQLGWSGIKSYSDSRSPCASLAWKKISRMQRQGVDYL